MNAVLDEGYLGWLYQQTGYPQEGRHPQTHWCLLQQMHKTPFVVHIPNDLNRAVDGQDLRFEFLDLHLIHSSDPAWLEKDCTMLELLIALARQLAFETAGELGVWFWHLISVLGLMHYDDRNYNITAEGVIDETLNRVNHRQYEYNGQGGLFPLRNPHQDQREVELWIQLNAYLNEL